MKDITKYRGCLKQFDLNTINDDLIDFMINKDIIYEMDDFLDDNMSNEELELYSTFGFPLVYKNKAYNLNNDIHNDIYNIIEEGVSFAPQDWRIYKETSKIEKTVFSELTIKNKLKALRKQHKKLFSKVNDVSYYLMYEKHLDNPIYDESICWTKQQGKEYCWKRYCMEQITWDKQIMIDYFTKNNHHFLNNDDSEETDNMFSIKHPTTSIMRKFNKVKRISDFIQNEIDKLEKPNRNQKGKSIKSLTIREKVLLIQAIRDIEVEVWDNLKPTDKEKLFNPLVNGNERNVREYITEIDKKPSEKPVAANESQEKIAILLSSLGI